MNRRISYPASACRSSSAPTARSAPSTSTGTTDSPPRPLQCRSCAFGFLYELLEDYYPAPETGFVVCDRDARVLAAGRGVFELTGYRDADLIGREVVEALALSDSTPIEVVREWGVRKMGQELEIRTSAGFEKRVVIDFFPAYDDDGGLLLALTPR